MAIVQCPECGRDVSGFARSCPNCGNPINDTIEDIIEDGDYYGDDYGEEYLSGESMVYAPRSTSAPPQKHRKKWIVIWIVAAVVVVSTIAFFGVKSK